MVLEADTSTLRRILYEIEGSILILRALSDSVAGDRVCKIPGKQNLFILLPLRKVLLGHLICLQRLSGTFLVRTVPVCGFLTLEAPP